MRYESFYPFARQPSSPFSLGQPGYGAPPQMGRMSGGMPPFQGMGGPSGNPFSGQTQGGAPGVQGISKMESYMQTANRFLTTAQQYAPVVQQFAPMMQNLPAMWKLYKGFQSLPSTGASTGGGIAAASARTVAQTPPGGVSVPRIFQPPI